MIIVVGFISGVHFFLFVVVLHWLVWLWQFAWAHLCVCSNRTRNHIQDSIAALVALVTLFGCLFLVWSIPYRCKHKFTVRFIFIYVFFFLFSIRIWHFYQLLLYDFSTTFHIFYFVFIKQFFFLSVFCFHFVLFVTHHFIDTSYMLLSKCSIILRSSDHFLLHLFHSCALIRSISLSLVHSMDTCKCG